MSGSLIDVPGLLVGHHSRRSRGWLTGTTVVLAPGGAVAGVDVRGGAPGTRETDLLRPENLIEQVHAVCLTGGSAYGLAAVDGVMGWLGDRGIGYRVGDEPQAVVPIVPAAVIFDLGRGGSFTNRPDRAFGVAAAEDATTRRRAVARRAGPSGNVGAGIGALCSGIKGGIGSASVRLADGTVVAALAVVNAAGSVVAPGTGLPYVDDPAAGLRRPAAAERRALLEHLRPVARPVGANTTIGVVATDAPLTKAECTRLAGAGQDGIARAVRPAHLFVDGDTVFGLSLASRDAVLGHADARYSDPAGRTARLDAILAAGAEAFALAVTRGVIGATAIRTIPSYRSLCPSAFRAAPSPRPGPR